MHVEVNISDNLFGGRVSQSWKSFAKPIFLLKTKNLPEKLKPQRSKVTKRLVLTDCCYLLIVYFPLFALMRFQPNVKLNLLRMVSTTGSIEPVIVWIFILGQGYTSIISIHVDRRVKLLYCCSLHSLTTDLDYSLEIKHFQFCITACWGDNM